MQYEKPLKVGKLERYELGVGRWTDGEPLISATVTLDDKATLNGAVDISGEVIGFFLTGASKGACKVKFDYATATRTDSFTAVIPVI